MATTLRFTLIVAGAAVLIVTAAAVLTARDWVSTSQGIAQRIAVQTPAPVPPAGTAAAQPAAGSGHGVAPAAADSMPGAAAPAAVAAVAAVGQAPAGQAQAAVSTKPGDQEHAVGQAAERRAGRGRVGDGTATHTGDGHDEVRGGGDR